MAMSTTEKYGKENIVALLGSPDGDSSELYAETLINGDPAWIGPLAGISLDLPVFHVLEPEVKEKFDPKVAEEHLALMEMALDVESIIKGLDRVRKK